MRLSLLPILLLATSAAAQMGPQNVVLAPVERRAVEISRPLVGDFEAVTRSSVATEEPGLVAQRSFEEGQKVEKGAVLVRLNVDLLKVERQAAEAALHAAEAALEEAKAQSENTQREFERLKGLWNANTATVKEYQDALTAQQVASATLNVRSATIAQRKADLARLDLMIDKSAVPAPFTGVVSRRRVEVGQWLEKGAVVAEVVQMDPLFVRVNVPEDLIGKVEKGQSASVVIDALGGRTVTGTVEQILPEADPSSRTFAVKLLVQNGQGALRPGLFARVVLASSTDASFVVPRDALVVQGNRAHVVAMRDGKAVLVPVEAGRTVGGQVPVSGDLKEGDQVVVRGNESLRGGEALAPLR